MLHQQNDVVLEVVALEGVYLLSNQSDWDVVQTTVFESILNLGDEGVSLFLG